MTLGQVGGGSGTRHSGRGNGGGLGHKTRSVHTYNGDLGGNSGALGGYHRNCTGRGSRQQRRRLVTSTHCFGRCTGHSGGGHTRRLIYKTRRQPGLFVTSFHRRGTTGGHRGHNRVEVTGRLTPELYVLRVVGTRSFLRQRFTSAHGNIGHNRHGDKGTRHRGRNYGLGERTRFFGGTHGATTRSLRQDTIYQNTILDHYHTYGTGHGGHRGTFGGRYTMTSFGRVLFVYCHFKQDTQKGGTIRTQGHATNGHCRGGQGRYTRLFVYRTHRGERVRYKITSSGTSHHARGRAGGRGHNRVVAKLFRGPGQRSYNGGGVHGGSVTPTILARGSKAFSTSYGQDCGRGGASGGFFPTKGVRFLLGGTRGGNGGRRRSQGRTNETIYTHHNGLYTNNNIGNVGYTQGRVNGGDCSGR